MNDLELKRLFVRRVCRAHRATEPAVIALLHEFIPPAAAQEWGSLPDVDELVAAARAAASAFTPSADGGGGGGGSPGSVAHFRKPAAFQAPSPEGAQLVTFGSNDALLGSVDYSSKNREEQQALLRRLKKTAKSSKSVVSRTDDFRTQLDRARNTDPSLTAIDFANRADFAALDPAHKVEAVRLLASCAQAGALSEVHLDAVGLDLSVAEVLGQLLRAPGLRTLTLTANRLNEAALQRLALSMHGHPGLIELALGEQHGTALSTHAIKELLDAAESTPTLVKLRLGTVHDDLQRRRHISIETRHVEAMRKLNHDRKSQRGGGDDQGGLFGLFAKQRRSQAEAEEERRRAAELAKIDTVWTREASRIAATKETTFGKPRNPGDVSEDLAAEAAGGTNSGAPPKLPWRDPTTHYILTGSPEWRTATKAERRAVIEAFATNRKLTTVCMSDSAIDDDLARSWASVLAQPTCLISSLTLESNPISSSGIEAIASALASNSSLTDLRLRNLHGKVSKHAEESLGEALEHHTKLTKLYVDLRSFKAQDLMTRYLTRNEMARRAAMGWGNNEKLSKQPTAGGLWDPAWKPPAQRAKIGAKVVNSGLGRHVTLAKEKWEGFVGRTLTARAANGSEKNGLDTQALFDPEALPEIDVEAPTRNSHAALPFVSLADLTKDVERKAAEMMAGREAGAGAEDEADKPELKKKKSSKSNPVASEVAEVAEAHHDEAVAAVAALEERRSRHEEEDRLQHDWHMKLAWMLESSGELLPPTSRNKDKAPGGLAA